MANRVAVTNRFPKRVRSAPVRRALQALLKEEGVCSAEVSVLICDDDEIQSLNRQFRSVNSVTDVLSFPMDGVRPDECGTRWLGDVVLSVETAARQAAQHGHCTETECVLLAIHGALHLLGYEDATEEGAARMSKRAKDLSRTLGYLPRGHVALVGETR